MCEQREEQDSIQHLTTRAARRTLLLPGRHARSGPAGRRPPPPAPSSSTTRATSPQILSSVEEGRSGESRKRGKRGRERGSEQKGREGGWKDGEVKGEGKKTRGENPLRRTRRRYNFDTERKIS
eukprot:747341-Hanusia_phi.AAC.2